MAKLDLILENIRDEYMINLLEESEVSELQALKTKKFLNESLGRIRKSLIEEGNMDAVKQHLKNNWGKYLAGAGAAGAVGTGLAYGDEIKGLAQNALDKYNGKADSMTWLNQPKEVNGIGVGEALDDTKGAVGGRIASAAAQNAQSAATADEQDAILNPRTGTANVSTTELTGDAGGNPQAAAARAQAFGTPGGNEVVRQMQLANQENPQWPTSGNDISPTQRWAGGFESGPSLDQLNRALSNGELSKEQYQNIMEWRRNS